MGLWAGPPEVPLPGSAKAGCALSILVTSEQMSICPRRAGWKGNALTPGQALLPILQNEHPGPDGGT